MNTTSRSVDYVVLGIVLSLVVFGLLMLTSATSAVAFERFGDTYWFMKHQLLYGVLPGLALMAVLSRIPYVFWKRVAGFLLWVSVALLVLVFIPGIGADFGTARSWVEIPGLGFSFQPAEIVKLTFLLYLAAWFENRREKDLKGFTKGFIPFLTSLGVVTLLILLQPDVGTVSVIVAIALAVYVAAGAPWTHLLGFGSLGAVLLFFLIKFAPYRAARFTTFLHPELDPQGIGYHVNQALLAVGSGGLFGLGYGQSRQKFQYLPEVASDSIFAVMAEEFGFLISGAFVFVYAVLAYRLGTLAAQARDRFGQYVTVGVLAWIAFQAFVNIGAMLALLPITGIPLPLVSYGGTSMVVLLSALGIVLNISRSRV
ncbi:cell division protein FtsW [Candidatus Uhrbacteria bacterium RIFCSPLOWO2_01_FULL_53_9]|uniref:Probable peptidoglycan glycosyltransferase FtsW n=2 Tax=Candidatus Uhriibacteriota TaxID=1752732 RepID=A0A1F7UYL7_9BACT|nr:MAG: cell division protein FtsW [Candidatus Uhrbacteria bacterium RIFCSPLOWO2_01_FULL_53_9]OGL89503.1 MAG: cell division protein FtsW [Candidatus Uhrbacteria bacterium RIFCSPLOWO2_02_FULL_53_10]